jgi:hypothetical protein
MPVHLANIKMIDQLSHWPNVAYWQGMVGLFHSVKRIQDNKLGPA